jgi:hypothetical protein
VRHRYAAAPEIAASRKRQGVVIAVVAFYLMSMIAFIIVERKPIEEACPVLLETGKAVKRP